MKRPRKSKDVPVRHKPHKDPQGHPFEPDEKNASQPADTTAVAQPSTSPP